MCASKGKDWYEPTAVLIATKSPDVVRRALDVVRAVREQSAIEEPHDILKELVILLRGRLTLLSLRNEEYTWYSDSVWCL